MCAYVFLDNKKPEELTDNDQLPQDKTEENEEKNDNPTDTPLFSTIPEKKNDSENPENSDSQPSSDFSQSIPSNIEQENTLPKFEQKTTKGKNIPAFTPGSVNNYIEDIGDMSLLFYDYTNDPDVLKEQRKVLKFVQNCHKFRKNYNEGIVNKYNLENIKRNKSNFKKIAWNKIRKLKDIREDCIKHAEEYLNDFVKFFNGNDIENIDSKFAASEKFYLFDGYLIPKEKMNKFDKWFDESFCSRHFWSIVSPIGNTLNNGARLIRDLVVSKDVSSKEFDINKIYEIYGGAAKCKDIWSYFKGQKPYKEVESVFSTCSSERIDYEYIKFNKKNKNALEKQMGKKVCDVLNMLLIDFTGVLFNVNMNLVCSDDSSKMISVNDFFNDDKPDFKKEFINWKKFRFVFKPDASIGERRSIFNSLARKIDQDVVDLLCKINKHKEE
jgi:hypothetical protein